MTLLAVPEKGFQRSVNVNNVDRIAFADWIDASTLFLGESTSVSEIIDVLTEAGVLDAYEEDGQDENSQSLAASVAWEGLNAFETFLNYSARGEQITISRDLIASKITWDDDPYRSFLLCLSLTESYPQWAKACAEIGDQGLLFEQLSAEACRSIFSGWEIYDTAWSKDEPKKILDVVGDLSGLLGSSGCEDAGDWVSSKAKDAGLDLYCFPRFRDEQEHVPQMAIQCASGRDWVNKLGTPSPNKWQKLLNTSFESNKGMTIPFLTEESTKKEKCVDSGGFLLDRPRLLSSLIKRETEFEKRLVDWCTPRIELLKCLRLES